MWQIIHWITWSADQTWQIIHWESWLVKVRHNTKQACLQGETILLWNQCTDPICYEICAWNKDKIRGQKSFKDDTKCIIYTRRMSIQSMQFMHIDSLGNTWRLYRMYAFSSIWSFPMLNQWDSSSKNLLLFLGLLYGFRWV